MTAAFTPLPAQDKLSPAPRDRPQLFMGSLASAPAMRFTCSDQLSSDVTPRIVLLGHWGAWSPQLTGRHSTHVCTNAHRPTCTRAGLSWSLPRVLTSPPEGQEEVDLRSLSSRRRDLCPPPGGYKPGTRATDRVRWEFGQGGAAQREGWSVPPLLAACERCWPRPVRFRAHLGFGGADTMKAVYPWALMFLGRWPVEPSDSGPVPHLPPGCWGVRAGAGPLAALSLASGSGGPHRLAVMGTRVTGVPRSRELERHSEKGVWTLSSPAQPLPAPRLGLARDEGNACI